MRFIQMLIRALASMARRTAGVLSSLGAQPEPEPEMELPEDPMVAKANAEIEMLRRAADIPGHSLQGPAHVSNQIRCYAMSDEERRPFMSLRGVPEAQVGWLKSLDDAGLSRLASATHQSIWHHVSGAKEIPGVPSFAGRSEVHWRRARPYAGSNIVEIQDHLPPAVLSDGGLPQPSMKDFG
ncbi:hypothetical protein MBRA_06304 [Methylobacterium brachiatum]|nr:hypothetical protein MBRA_06304 [Methylobacterium brachiatum]